MHKIITEEEFYNSFIPVKNHIIDDASWSGCLFETYGTEIDYCYALAKSKNVVWTVLETSEDYIFNIVSGFHLVNRLGFLITEIAYTEDIEVVCD